jgi:hypothetical protein
MTDVYVLIHFDFSKGELIFSEDQEAAKHFAELKKQQELEKAELRKKRQSQPSAPERVNRPYTSLTRSSIKNSSQVRESTRSGLNRYNQPYPCEDCGQMTHDWVKLVPDTGKCLCRECNKRRISGG